MLLKNATFGRNQERTRQDSNLRHTASEPVARPPGSRAVSLFPRRMQNHGLLPLAPQTTEPLFGCGRGGPSAPSGAFMLEGRVKQDRRRGFAFLVEHTADLWGAGRDQGARPGGGVGVWNLFANLNTPTIRPQPWTLTPV